MSDMRKAGAPYPQGADRGRDLEQHAKAKIGAEDRGIHRREAQLYLGRSVCGDRGRSQPHHHAGLSPESREPACSAGRGQVSSGFEASNGRPLPRMYRSHIPQICEVATAVITSAV